MTNGERVMSMIPNEVFTEHAYPQLGEFNSHIELVIDKEWWNSEYEDKVAEKKAKAIKLEHSCVTCKYGNLYSDSEPCCNCTDDNDMFEPIESEVENGNSN